MKNIKKKIYEALPSRVTKGYRIARKTIILHIVYPFTYKFFTLTKKLNKNKVVFIETRFDKITDSFTESVILKKISVLMMRPLL